MTVAAVSERVQYPRPRGKALHGPGLIGVIAQDTARFTMFAASLTGLDVPEGSAIKWQIGHAIAENTNELVRATLATAGAQWLWILGDDHVFSPGILKRLLAVDADIVVPLCLGRTLPYQPVIRMPVEGDATRRAILDLGDHADGGVIDVHSAGSAGMLVRREVLEWLEAPWFESGKLADGGTGEDFYFCDKARDAGFSIKADLDVLLGHITTATVWPVKEAEGWTYGFGFAGGMKITMPVGQWDTETEGGV